MTRRFLLSLVVALAAWGAPAVKAQAQAPGSLVPEIIQSTNELTPAQGAQLQEYIQDGLRHLVTGDPAEIKRGREMLLDPFKQGKKPSVSFRTAYGQKLAPELEKLVKDEGSSIKDTIAVNALRIAGEAATPESASVVEQALADKRTAVRFAAATGLGRTLESVNNREFSPAISANRLVDAVGKLGAAASNEQSPQVLDAAIRSLLAGTRIDREKHEAVREAAMAMLADKASGRLRALGGTPQDEPAAEALLRAVNGMRLAVAGPTSYTKDAYKKGAELAGHSIAYVQRNLKAFAPEAAGGKAEIQKKMLNEAETLIQAASQKAGGPAYQPQNLAGDLGNERTFQAKFLATLKYLQGPPFSFPIGTFVAPGAEPPAGGG
jgi:hypothetical protein